jgi:hypothetical protein
LFKTSSGGQFQVFQQTRRLAVPQSVLEAIKLGIWDYEPEPAGERQYGATRAMPGTHEKLEVMARRLAEGLPLWHPEDRRTYEESERRET